MRSSGTYYYHNDQLGTPKLITDENQNVVWKGRATAFGYVDIDIAQIENNIRFPGQYYDFETGLHYNYHRYYDPALGRYLTSDPIGLAGGINTYAYVEGNPINFVAPLGLCPCGDPNNLIALARNDKRDWSKQADRSDLNSGFDSGTYKCNLYADTMYDAADFNLPNIGGGFLARLFGKYPPGAQSASDASYEIPGWPVVTGPAQAGDFLAGQGHVGIATSPNTSISASPVGVVENDWGFRGYENTVIRRCTCP